MLQSLASSYRSYRWQLMDFDLLKVPWFHKTMNHSHTFHNSSELAEFKNQVKALIILKRSKRSAAAACQKDNFGFNSYNLLTFGILTFNIVAALVTANNNNNLNNNNNNDNLNMLGSQSTSNSVSRDQTLFKVPRMNLFYPSRTRKLTPIQCRLWQW